MPTGGGRWRWAVAAAALLASPALAQQGTLENRGAALLSKQCARCHAVGLTGASPHPAAPPFRTLSQRYPIDSLAEALAEGLMSGHPDMPEFVFRPDEIGAILAYLQAIQQR
jgi:mono/diheme cytochrome c family protein